MNPIGPLSELDIVDELGCDATKDGWVCTDHTTTEHVAGGIENYYLTWPLKESDFETWWDSSKYVSKSVSEPSYKEVAFAAWEAALK